MQAQLPHMGVILHELRYSREARKKLAGRFDKKQGIGTK